MKLVISDHLNSHYTSILKLWLSINQWKECWNLWKLAVCVKRCSRTSKYTCEVNMFGYVFYHSFISTVYFFIFIFFCHTGLQAEWIISDSRPPDDWPEQGNIAVEEFDLKYREGLPLVLKNINCNIKPGEKVC